MLAVIILGLIIGSFLNVCIYRLPKNESIIKPASHCPTCKKEISWFDNIPILSFIILGGRCRFCKSRISYRYPLVEFLAALASAILFIRFGFSINFLVYSILSFGLIVAAFIDFEYKIIPDEITIGGLVLGIFLSIVWPNIHNTMLIKKSIIDCVLGILVGGGSILLSGILGKFFFKKDAMGGGDIKLLAMIGSFIGWKKILLTFFLAPFFGIFFGIYFLIKYRNHYIPYGPFLSLASFAAILFGDDIIKLIF